MLLLKREELIAQLNQLTLGMLLYFTFIIRIFGGTFLSEGVNKEYRNKTECRDNASFPFLSFQRGNMWNRKLNGPQVMVSHI